MLNAQLPIFYFSEMGQSFCLGLMGNGQGWIRRKRR
jgi:hypothetical protein